MAERRVPDEVFVDTCILVSFVQREWERTRSTDLVESDDIEVVVSQNVIDEFEAVTDRRRDIYEDVIDFLLEQEEVIEDYDPGDRRVYIGPNDAGHVRNLQMHLASVADRREVLHRLRRFLRAARRRVEYVESSLEDRTVTPGAPFGLELALASLLDHRDDAIIVTDAAGWTAEGGSGVLVTLDNDDLLDHERAIEELLLEEQGPEWVLRIVRPADVLPDEPVRKQAE